MGGGGCDAFLCEQGVHGQPGHSRKGPLFKPTLVNEEENQREAIFENKPSPMRDSRSLDKSRNEAPDGVNLITKHPTGLLRTTRPLLRQKHRDSASSPACPSHATTLGLITGRRCVQL